MHRSIVGTRIRQRRREVGVTQVALADRLGISPSYLNLIEWNKRPIAGSLLRRTAEALDLDLDELSGTAERRLLEALLEVARIPELRDLAIEDDRSGELIGRFPGWARCLATLARSERDATARARTLSERLSNDPFLGETIHRMLSRIAAVRSAAEILNEYPDAPTEQRRRFTAIVFDEVRALSDVGEALVAYLDKADDPDRILTPIDEVDAVFEVRANHFGEIEGLANGAAPALTDVPSHQRRQTTQAALGADLDQVVDQVIASQPQIKTATARDRARAALTDYGILAAMMPLPAFADHAATAGYDVEVLATAFGVDFAAVCRRLVALPAAEGRPRFGYYGANAAGTIVEMRGLPGIAVPRYAAACPLWLLYRAQQSPETVMRQRVVFPSGDRFMFVARAHHAGPSGFGVPRHYLTDMLATTDADARQTVYAADPATPVEEVGPSCRLCPRTSCHHRVEDPFAA